MKLAARIAIGIGLVGGIGLIVARHCLRSMQQGCWQQCSAASGREE